LILIVSAEAPTGEALRSGAVVVHFHHAGHEVDGLELDVPGGAQEARGGKREENDQGAGCS
jgi:hypothetical protein